MANPLLPPDQRFALNWLAGGGQLWVHNFGLRHEAILHAGNRVQRLASADFDKLLGDGLIKPLLTTDGSTSYEITDAGRERLED